MSKQLYGLSSEVNAVEISSAVNVENLDPVCVNLYEETAALVGTMSIEGSVDGTNFAAMDDIFGNSLAGLTAAGWYQLPAGLKSVRVNMTAWTSGGAILAAGGIDKTLKS